MISATGRRPVIAAPIAAPRIACSEIGVSITRRRTELVEQPGGRLEHPAGAGDVLADQHHPLVARASPARCRARRRRDRSVAPRRASVGPDVGDRRSPGRGSGPATWPPRWPRRRRPRPAASMSVELAPASTPRRSSRSAVDGERVVGLPGLDLARRPVLAGVGPRVAAVPVGQRLDQRRARRRDGRARGRRRARQVAPRRRRCRRRRPARARTPRRGPRPGAGTAVMSRDRGVLHVEVVLADEDDRQLEHRGVVERLVEGADVGRAVAEEAHGDLAADPRYCADHAAPLAMVRCAPMMA